MSFDMMHMPGPCVVCGDTNYTLSCGGPTICPKCDCGNFDAATVMKQAKVIAELREQLRCLAQAQTGCDKEATFGEDGYNPAYDDGITFAIVQLAELTGSKDWQMRDGSEDHDTDVRDTIMDVLKCAGLYDDETGKFAALAQAAAPPSLQDTLASCKGEHSKFEAWATAQKYDMSEHPIHYLFTDPKTYAARQGWKAALEYVASSLPSADLGSAAK